MRAADAETVGDLGEADLARANAIYFAAEARRLASEPKAMDLPEESGPSEDEGLVRAQQRRVRAAQAGGMTQRSSHLHSKELARKARADHQRLAREERLFFGSGEAGSARGSGRPANALGSPLLPAPSAS